MNTGYLVPHGILKIVEFICLLISWSLIEDAYKGGFHSFRHDYVKFLEGIDIIAWIFVIVWFVLNIAGLLKRMSGKASAIVIAVVHFVLGLLLLIAGSLLASKLRSGKPEKLAASVAFGIISAILFVADGVVHIVFKGNDQSETATA